MIDLRVNCKLVSCIQPLSIRFIFAVCLSLFLFHNPVHATDRPQDSDLPFTDEEALFWGEEEKIFAATKHIQHLSEAPAIATVITAEQIRNMGARNLMDILKIVPGLEVYIAKFGQNEIAVRGIKTDSTEKVKVLIDGHSINEPFMGSAMTLHDDIEVDNIKRVEIIRGPGSALYGANAFLAVINIVTFDAEDIDGVKITTGGGSFSTKRYNVLFGKKKGDFEITGSIGYLDTDGARLDVDKDKAGNPGRTLLWKEKNDYNLKVAYKKMTLNTKHTKRSRSDYMGLPEIPNDESRMDLYQYFIETGYRHNIRDNIEVIYKVYYDEFDEDILFETDPNTEYLDVTMTNRTIGGEIKATGDLSDNNSLTVGLAYEDIKQFNVSFHKGTPPGSLVLVPENWNKDGASRKVFATYIQDDWHITKDIGLTAGVRYDNYSDFGDTLNPRTGLVWKATDDLTVKILYGQAFRAPNFRELYDRGNDFTKGNEDLKPETIKTFESGIEYKANNHFSGRVNYFFNSIRDIIIAEEKSGPDPFINSEKLDVQGVELDLKARLKGDTYAYLNYSFQSFSNHNHSEGTGNRMADVPIHKGNIGGNVKINRHFNLNANLFLRDKSIRSKDDTRQDDLPGYALVDLTLIAKEFFDTMQVRCSIYNLFDKEYSDPSLKNTDTASQAADDYPRPGRTIMVDLSYSF